VLDGLASATITLSAALGFKIDPVPIPQIHLPTMTIPSVQLDLLASVSVGIHISICWVVNVGWDGSWQFDQGFQTPELTVTV
jgi:hypothetical protein